MNASSGGGQGLMWRAGKIKAVQNKFDASKISHVLVGACSRWPNGAREIFYLRIFHFSGISPAFIR